MATVGFKGLISPLLSRPSHSCRHKAAARWPGGALKLSQQEIAWSPSLGRFLPAEIINSATGKAKLNQIGLTTSSVATSR